MGVKFADKAATTITGDIAADATSVTVSSVSGFPTITGAGDYFYATIERVNDTTTYEVVKVTNLSSTTYTIDRSVESSSTFSAGDTFALRLNEHALVDPSLLQAGITTDTLTVDNVIVNGTTIGHTDDTDLMTLTANTLTVAGEVEATSLDINGAASIAGAITDVTDLTASGTVTAEKIDLESSGNEITLGASNASSIKHDGHLKFKVDNNTIFKGTDGNTSLFKVQPDGSTDVLIVRASGIDVTGEVQGDTLDIDGNAAITGTVTIDPPLVTSVAEGLGAKGIIMKQGDLRMKVDGDYDADASTNSKGGSTQNNSRIIFDSEQHEHVQSEGLGYQNPAFVIQANYNHNADNATHGTTAGEEYLDANISQLGLGNLTISSGKLQLRGKLTGADDGSLSNDGAASDGFFGHESFIGMSIDGSATNGTLTNLHFGRINDSTQNIRLQPSAGGIIVEGMGTAGSPTASKSDSGTIGTFNDEDLITLAQNQVTVAGELEATSLDINGAADIFSDLTLSGAEKKIDFTDSTARNNAEPNIQYAGNFVIKSTGSTVNNGFSIINADANPKIFEAILETSATYSVPTSGPSIKKKGIQVFETIAAKRNLVAGGKGQDGADQGTVYIGCDIDSEGDSVASGGDAQLIFETHDGGDDGQRSLIFIKPPSSLASNKTITLPSSTGTLALTSDITVTADSTTTFTNKSISGEQINSGTVAAARVATLNQDTTGNAATATIAKGAAVIHSQSTDGSTIGHATVAGYVGKTVVYTNTGDSSSLTLGVPQCTEDVAIGEQIHLVNASTGSGASAKIIFDLNESGDAQNINICTGATVADVGTTDPHIVAGGVATLVAVAANEWILFGSGVVDNS